MEIRMARSPNPIPPPLQAFGEAGRGRYFRALGVVLILGAILTIGVAALVTYLSRQSAVAEAAESAARNPHRPDISIVRAKGESEWRVLAFGDPSEWEKPPFTYELETGWIVRVRGAGSAHGREGDTVDAVLSRGYLIDLLSGTAGLVWIGAGVSLLVGIILTFWGPLWNIAMGPQPHASRFDG
jgi:hypothetical protein